MDDDCGEACGGDPVESVGQAIESDDDADGGKYTGDWSPDTRLGFKCRTREGAGSGVGTEAGSDGICDTYGD